MEVPTSERVKCELHCYTKYNDKQYGESVNWTLYDLF